jgi:hypothetical protein
MPLPTPSGLRSILSVLTVAIAYSLSLWRIIKGNRGNRVIECGSIALMIALIMVVLIKIPNLPDWVQPSLGLLLLLLCLLIIFFLLLRGVQAIRRRKPSTDAFGDRAFYELDSEPRNAREKWLLRIVYWGASLLVAVIWWEYVKAR